MSDFITLLEQFNRKERFFLFLRATGKDELKLSTEFEEQLSKKIGVKVPDCAYAATDYHLDWLAASVKAYQSGLSEEQYIGKPFPNHGEQKTVKGSQEDIDLLIAFKEKGTDSYHVILVEAKGYGSWDSAQLRSKAERLKQIFPNPDKDGIRPHFCLLSPKKPQRLSAEIRRDWPHWTCLDVPVKRLEVTRIDSGGNFKICHGGLRTGP